MVVTQQGKIMGALKLLQLSDTHLFANPGNCLKGVNTAASLQRVLEHLKPEHQKPDLVLLTGDLAEKGEAKAYQNLLKFMERFNCPIYALPGNHDDRTTMQLALADSKISMQKSIVIGDWHFILLDSLWPQRNAGLLSDDELEFARVALAQYADKNICLAIHHHVQPVGGLMDTMILTNAEQLLALITATPNVRVVINGHVHQEFAKTISGVQYLGLPSTCYQITPQQTSFVPDDLPPGYRWLELFADGTVISNIVRT